MSTRAEFFQSMYPGLSDGEVIDELIKASIYGFEHGPEVVTISAAEGKVMHQAAIILAATHQLTFAPFLPTPEPRIEPVATCVVDRAKPI